MWFYAFMWEFPVCIQNHDILHAERNNVKGKTSFDKNCIFFFLPLQATGKRHKHFVFTCSFPAHISFRVSTRVVITSQFTAHQTILFFFFLFSPPRFVLPSVACFQVHSLLSREMTSSISPLPVNLSQFGPGNESFKRFPPLMMKHARQLWQVINWDGGTGSTFRLCVRWHCFVS